MDEYKKETSLEDVVIFLHENIQETKECEKSFEQMQQGVEGMQKSFEQMQQSVEGMQKRINQQEGGLICNIHIIVQ